MTTSGIWDYSGLIADAYDHYFGAEPFWDQAYYFGRVQANGGRALEIACGTGRLLLPLLRDGLQVEGLDTSADMLARLRHKAAVMNLSPRLHQAPMQDFDLPQRFRTVFVPAGSFQILVEDEHVHRALDNFARALEPGGEVLIPIDPSRELALADGHWRLRRQVHVTAHGADLTVHERYELDPGGRLLHWHLRYEVCRPGDRIEAFFRRHLLRRYGAGEFEAQLVAAGFAEVRTSRGYTAADSADPAADLVLSARRP